MEINIENYEEKFELVAKSIRSCDFIAFDTEFSGNSFNPNKHLQVAKWEWRISPTSLTLSMTSIERTDTRYSDS